MPAHATGAFIANGPGTSPFDAAVRSGLKSLVDELLDALPPREAQAVRMRYCIDTRGDHATGHAAHLATRQWVVILGGARGRRVDGSQARKLALGARLFGWT